jgi:virginiamycin B lyase
MRHPVTIATIAAALLCAAPAFAEDWPDGPGKDTVDAVCGGCHTTAFIRAGYTPAGWDSVVHMMQNMEAPVPKDQWPVVQAYLTKNFPEKPKPEGKLIPGPVKATIKEWPVPTPGSRPHDPLATRDGMIWYTGQTAGVLGRLNPKTGKIKEFQLPTAHTGPHGLVEDKAGNIWYTGNRASLIGKLNPKTGKVTEYPLPDPNARDPHTLKFDHKGILWFTVQAGNKVGRLDPKTGEIKLVTPPTANARPYGVAVSSKGVVYFVEFGANKVATINDKMEIHEWTLPAADARPRRIAMGPDDTIWYTDYARGYLGHLDPKTGKVTEFLSPAGAKSNPYGIVFTKGALWYNESGAKPNTIVRFDPKSEKFQSWPIPGGGDIVRNMDVTPQGNPVLANSLVNKVGLVEIK